MACQITNASFCQFHYCTVQSSYVSSASKNSFHPSIHKCQTIIKLYINKDLLVSICYKVFFTVFQTNTIFIFCIKSNRVILYQEVFQNQHCMAAPKNYITLQLFRQDHNFIFTNNKPQLTTTKETVQFNFYFNKIRICTAHANIASKLIQ